MSSSLLIDLQRLLAPERVSDAPEELERFSGDALTHYRTLNVLGKVEVPPLVVVTPKNTHEVSALVSYASRRGIPIVPRGGGTGVMGGAVPVEDAGVDSGGSEWQGLSGDAVVADVAFDAEADPGRVVRFGGPEPVQQPQGDGR